MSGRPSISHDGQVTMLPARPKTFLTAFVFNVNVLMGSGILAMPYAIYISGWALGLGLLLIFAVLSYITICYNFEAQMRALCLAAALDNGLVRFTRLQEALDANSSLRLVSQRGHHFSGELPHGSAAAADAVTDSSDDNDEAEPAKGTGRSGGTNPRSALAGGDRPRADSQTTGSARRRAVTIVHDDGGEKEGATAVVTGSPASRHRRSASDIAGGDDETPRRRASSAFGGLPDDGRNASQRRSSLDPNNPIAGAMRASVMEALLEQLMTVKPHSPMLRPPEIELVTCMDDPHSMSLRGADIPASNTKAAGADHDTGAKEDTSSASSGGIVARDGAVNASNSGVDALLSRPLIEEIPFTGDEVPYESFDPEDYWEINDVLLLFGGRIAMYGWNLCNVLFQLGILWTFSVVLGSTATLGIPIVGVTKSLECNSNDADFGDRPECLKAIRIWFVVFASIMLALTAQDWGFMPLLQRVLAALVYVVVAIIMITCYVEMGSHDFPATTDDTKRDGAYVQRIAVFDGSGFGPLFGIAVFALLCHSATSLILKQMPSTASTKGVFMAAFSAIAVIYAAMGMTVAFYIGNRIEKVATLDWSIYREWGARGWAGSAIGNIVLFFPILSITPGFVLRTRSLTDAIETMMPIDKKVWLSKHLLRTPYYRSGKGVVYRFQIALRVLAILVALAASNISYKFAKAIKVTGLLGFFILFVFPLVAEMGSQRMLRRLGLPAATPFHGPVSHRATHWTLVALGAVSFAYYFYVDFIHPPVAPQTGLAPPATPAPPLAHHH